MYLTSTVGACNKESVMYPEVPKDSPAQLSENAWRSLQLANYPASALVCQPIQSLLFTQPVRFTHSSSSTRVKSAGRENSEWSRLFSCVVSWFPWAIETCFLLNHLHCFFWLCPISLTLTKLLSFHCSLCPSPHVMRTDLDLGGGGRKGIELCAHPSQQFSTLQCWAWASTDFCKAYHSHL